METFLVLNGYELSASIDEQERNVLDVAAGLMSRDAFTNWVKANLVTRAVDKEQTGNSEG